MRGRIVHYQPEEGRGLIAADGRQWAFSIAQWQADIAPRLDALVDFADADGRPEAIVLVSRWGRLREWLRARHHRPGRPHPP